jgi:hypothetical protein
MPSPSQINAERLVTERCLKATKRATRRCQKCGTWYPWQLTENKSCLFDGWYPGAPVIIVKGSKNA